MSTTISTLQVLQLGDMIVITIYVLVPVPAVEASFTGKCTKLISDMHMFETTDSTSTCSNRHQM